MIIQNCFPEIQWSYCTPEDAGFLPEKLAGARHFMDEASNAPAYRVVIVRYGHIVAEWNQGVTADERLSLASAAKSVLSSLLGIAIREGRVTSPNARLVDTFPEALDVPEGTGPKSERYAYPKDQEITLRQLLSNTSGYMKPGEEPGRVFNYQTYGMNVTGHAIATAYGTYDPLDPEDSPDLQPLYAEKIARPIGAQWSYRQANFELPAAARIQYFGYGTGIESTALDMARLGWLWCNWGEWAGKQIIPAAWLRQATQTALEIRQHCPSEEWCYGYAFWTNDYGKVWPDLPHDSFAAAGAGYQKIWVWPRRSLVVVESPGAPAPQFNRESGLIKHIVDACI